MTSDVFRALVFDCLRRVAPEADPAAIDPARAFHDQLAIDSVDYLNFVMTLEERLGHRIAEADYPRFSTLNGCLAYLAAEGVSVPGAPQD